MFKIVKKINWVGYLVIALILLLVVAVQLLIYKESISDLMTGKMTVPYNTHNVSIRHEENSSIEGIIEASNIGGTRYLIVPSNTPKYINLYIVDERDWSEHILKVNTETLSEINNVPYKVVKSEFPVVRLNADANANWEEFNQNTTPKGVDIECVIESSDLGLPKADIKVSRHGSSSWAMCAKHSYNIKFSEPISLYGMPENKSWCLIANGIDKTSARNMVANKLAEKMGYPYIAGMKYVTLMLNNKFAGVYLLTEKAKKVMERDINPNAGDFVIVWMDTDDDLSVPITFKHNNFEGAETTVNNVQGYYANVVVPDADEAPFDKEYYRSKVQELVDSIEENSIEKIDLDSWVKYFWVQETSKNFDAWYRSAYSVYKAKEDKWYQGTIWDFDRGWQYCCLQNGIDFTNADGTISTYGLYPDLFNNEEFKDAVYDYYNNSLDSILTDLHSYVLSCKKQLTDLGSIDYMIYADNKPEISTDDLVDLAYADSFENVYNNFITYYCDRIEALRKIYKLR